MKIKESKYSIHLTWDKTSKKDIADAMEQYYIYIRKFWWPGTMVWSLSDYQLGTMPKSFFQREDELYLEDLLPSMLNESLTLDEIIHQLADQGFSPCISTRGIGKKAFFRFHVDRARNYWADHKNIYTAAINALKLWKRAGRPIFPPLDTGEPPSEEAPPRKLRLIKLGPVYVKLVNAYLRHQHNGSCIDVASERNSVAKGVVAFINKHLEKRKKDIKRA